jgi:integrase
MNTLRITGSPALLPYLPLGRSRTPSRTAAVPSVLGLVLMLAAGCALAGTTGTEFQTRYTGCRAQEVCRLQSRWEVAIPELGTSVFLIPANFGGRRPASGVKNGEDRPVVLNAVARSVIEGQRGLHPTWVFAYSGRALARMNDTAWKKGRKRAAELWELEHGQSAPAGLGRVRVHDLKHTFGQRLRAAGVTFEDRQVLLGHKNDSVTTHYSAPDVANLIAAANRVTASDRRKIDATTILRRKAG